METKFLLRQAFHLLIANILLISTQDVLADVSGRIHVANNRIFRGLEVAERGLAPQISMKYASISGWYTGLNVKTLEINPLERDTELTVFAGYGLALSDEASFDITLVSYQYPWIDLRRDYDWHEVQFNLSLNPQWRLSLGIAENWIASDQTTAHLEISHLYPLLDDLNLQITAGAAESSNSFGNDYLYGKLSLLYTATQSTYVELSAAKTTENFSPVIDMAGQNFSLGIGYLF